ncbi:MAG: PfkB family carbohydrate kinase [Patescibacteria group bacterium]
MIHETEIRTIFVGDIAFNRDVTPNRERTSIGGAAYYSAVGAIAAHRIEGLDSTVGIVSTVGGDFDVGNLLKKGVDIQGVSQISNERTCRFTIIQHEDNTREFEAERFVAENVDTNIFPMSYLSAKYIHLATSLPHNYLIWLKFLNTKTGAIISADAFEPFASQYPQLMITVLNMTKLIFINEAEVNILSKKGTLRTDIPWVFKSGVKGASYIEGTNKTTVSAPKVCVVETTGAGDVLAGAFLALLSHNFDV